jgi:hypothetical protein
VAVIKLVEDYAVTSLRNDVRDSLTLAGEQAILLQLFHSGDTDAQPCPQCGDDIYKSPEMRCPSCYGTTFDGGVRTATKVWALFTDDEKDELRSNRGEVQPTVRHMQTEAFPLLVEHDVVVRVKDWAADNTPAELNGYYILQQVTRRSLRTGSRVGQYPHDVVAQKAVLSALPEGAPLTNYPILGQHFVESVSLRSPTTAVVQPDVKVITFPFPFEAAPGGLTPAGGNRTFAQTVGDGVTTTFTLHHNLGTQDVTVGARELATGEEVEVDVPSRTPNTVTVRFASAPTADAYRIVVQGGG